MEIIDFSRLFQRHGGYSLPVLIELHYLQESKWYFTNNKQDIEWEGVTYKAVPMNYRFPSSRDGVPTGGTLEIDIDQYQEGELLAWFDIIDDKAEVEVVAIINEQGEITRVGQFRQKHGTVSWDGEKITWALGGDDRMEMQINPWNLDADALTG